MISLLKSFGHIFLSYINIAICIPLFMDVDRPCLLLLKLSEKREGGHLDLLTSRKTGSEVGPRKDLRLNL